MSAHLESNWPIILKAIRSQLGASQYDLSRFSGLSQSKISRLEKGKGRLTVAELKDLASILKVSPMGLEKGEIPLSAEMEKTLELFALKKRIIPQQYVLARSLTPFFHYLSTNYGEKKSLDLLHGSDLAEDILVFKDYKIDLQHLNILINNAVEQRMLCIDDLKYIGADSFSPELLGDFRFERISEEKRPFERLKMHFERPFALENFIKIHFKRLSRTNVQLTRFFRFGDQTFNQEHRTWWCEYFTHYLKAMLKGPNKQLGLDIQKLTCHWKGDHACTYELQLDY